MDRGYALNIQLMAKKKRTEKLLYEFDTNLSNFAITWPSPDHYYTNNFDLGSEFVRISDIPQDGYITEEEKGLLLFRGMYADSQLNIPGKEELFINVLVDAPEKMASQADQILDLLLEIKTTVEGGPSEWP